MRTGLERHRNCLGQRVRGWSSADRGRLESAISISPAMRRQLLRDARFGCCLHRRTWLRRVDQDETSRKYERVHIHHVFRSCGGRNRLDNLVPGAFWTATRIWCTRSSRHCYLQPSSSTITHGSSMTSASARCPTPLFASPRRYGAGTPRRCSASPIPSSRSRCFGRPEAQRGTERVIPCITRRADLGPSAPRGCARFWSMSAGEPREKRGSRGEVHGSLSRETVQKQTRNRSKSRDPIGRRDSDPGSRGARAFGARAHAHLVVAVGSPKCEAGTLHPAPKAGPSRGSAPRRGRTLTGQPSGAGRRRVNRKVVGAPGFGPGTSCAQGRRATRLRYAPTLAR
jgi:hypothetical protein